ncbi:uncharacterized protein LOC125958245 [Anopheles darlingi]|uniref:uncharacterized protein LOC125958245 n=1 Tax=Anopheles darlingi TaxID=43151 RepID=UPI0021005E8E|nr:uncharacterized protein LOC125958245 [Anopheles darlingi]
MFCHRGSVVLVFCVATVLQWQVLVATIGGNGALFAASITRALVPPRRDALVLGTAPSRVYGSVLATQLPEIIVNRGPTTVAPPQRDSDVGPSVPPGGYSYDPPSGSYLPPDSLIPPFADEPQPPPIGYLPPQAPSQQDIPAADEPVFESPAGEYLPPEQPPQRDEPVFVVSTPTPPAQDAGYIYGVPVTTTTFTPPFADEGVPEVNETGEGGYRYDPPAPASIYLPAGTGGVGRSLLRDEGAGAASVDGGGGRPSPIRLQLNELACLRSSGGFFRAALTLQSAIESVPLVDNDVGGGEASGCEVRLDQSRLLLDIPSADFGRCGVAACAGTGNGGTGGRPELCLRIRFPAIAGMRTALDPVLTLQCRIQQRIVARTHSLRLAVANDPQVATAAGQRSVSSTSTAFAVGGSQRPFRSQLGIFRRQNAATGGGSFTRPLQPGGAVLLGEELMLRTQVSAGDGWNFTRLSDVVMQRLSPTGTVLNSASLVTAGGCLNPLMRAISPLAPVFEAPLGYRLGFRAAMFQGMRSGDEMILRVRIIGCVDRRECLVENCATARSKRETLETDNATMATAGNDTTVVPLLTETASIAFRIMLPPNGTSGEQRGDDGEEPLAGSSGFHSSQSLLWITVGATVLLVIGGLALALLLVLRHQLRRPTYDEYRSD